MINWGQINWGQARVFASPRPQNWWLSLKCPSETLRFRVTVQDDQSNTDTDEVDITILDVP